VPSAHASRSTPPTARGHSGSSTTARFFGSIRPPTASSPRSPSPTHQSQLQPATAASASRSAPRS